MMSKVEMKMLLRETIEQEEPVLLQEWEREMRQREGKAGGAEAVLKNQVDQAMEMQDQLEQTEMASNPAGIREVVTERLLDYPGRPINQSDPTLIDREEMRMFDTVTRRTSRKAGRF